jgi:hypothetical protein
MLSLILSITERLLLSALASFEIITVSIEAAAAIQTKKISLGEYVAHFLSLSSLDDINRSRPSKSIWLRADSISTMMSRRFNSKTPEKIFVLALKAR